MVAFTSACDTEILGSATHDFRLCVFAVAIDVTMMAINSSLLSTNGERLDSGNSSAHVIHSNRHCDSRSSFSQIPHLVNEILSTFGTTSLGIAGSAPTCHT